MFFKRHIIFFFLSLGLLTKAQNLVNNGNFESYSNCPSNAGQINYAIGWSSYSNFAMPDYYNACSSFTNIGVPYAAFGFQQDCCGGTGYAGGFMLDKNAQNNDDRDYLITKLNDTLRIGHKYLASLYLNRGQSVDYGISTIGMLFTDTSTHLSGTTTSIISSPQVKNTNLLSDTLNWILVQDTFIAIKNEIYLTIGNFNSSITSDSVKLTNYWASFPVSYYYIDGVSVYEITGACNNYWDAGQDKHIFRRCPSMRWCPC